MAISISFDEAALFGMRLWFCSRFVLMPIFKLAAWTHCLVSRSCNPVPFAHSQGLVPSESESGFLFLPTLFHPVFPPQLRILAFSCQYELCVRLFFLRFKHEILWSNRICYCHFRAAPPCLSTPSPQPKPDTDTHCLTPLIFASQVWGLQWKYPLPPPQ